MERKHLWRSIAVALLLCSAHAQADETPLYLHASLGQIRQSFDAGNYFIASPAAGLDDDSSRLSWGMGIGYQLSEHFAAELSYLNAGAAKWSVGQPSIGMKTIESSMKGLILSFLPEWNFSDNVLGYIRLGALFARNELTNTYDSSSQLNDSFYDTTWVIGTGMEYTLMDHWSLDLEYVRTGNIQQKSSAVDNHLSGGTLGFKYRF